MANQTALHFTFGPVQGFVGQARRTRDLWAGSYLLSYLAGCAMSELHRLGGNIVLPDVGSDPLFLAIRRGQLPASPSAPAAQIGSLPNRFKATVDEGLDGTVCSDVIDLKWTELAGAVHDLLAVDFHLCLDEEAWKRQVENHWEYAWVIGGDDQALDVRKILRTHLAPPEPGEKCTICGERQEVSGLGLGSSSRQSMRDWWASLRKTLVNERAVHGATVFDLGENERLCAICLIKRAYPLPRVAKKVLGWEVPVNYPSTHYLSAVDWLIRVLKASASHPVVTQEIVKFVAAATAAGVWPAERTADIAGVMAAGSGSGTDSWETFVRLDGGAFFESVIRNEQEFELADSSQQGELIGALRKLQESLPVQLGESRKATPFYALLLMDGDGMGALLQDYRNHQQGIAQALAQFCKNAHGIVNACNGRLVYVGGDDVLALLPVDWAVECARRCREAYMQAFSDHAKEIPSSKATISAAIEYAHMQTALGVVVKDAHTLLDEVAKDSCGRDGLACRVWKRGGPVLTWAQPWEIVLETVTARCGGELHRTILDEVLYLFRGRSDGEGGGFSSKFFYKLAGLFELLDGSGALAGDAQAAGRLLAAEYLANREYGWGEEWTREDKRAEAEESVARLLALCHGRRRMKSGALELVGLGSDGALLVRFLAQKEV